MQTMMKFFNSTALIAALVFSALSMPVNAALIAGYTLDEANNIVTEDATGLQWLQWDANRVGFTTAENIAFYTSQAGGSWSIATQSQMAALFNNVGIAPDNTFSSTSDATFETASTSGDSTTDLPYRNFVNLFGVLFESSGIFVFDPRIATRVYYASDNPDFFGLARVQDDLRELNGLAGTVAFPASMSLTHEQIPRSVLLSANIAFVRQVDVPEPGMISLLALGLLGVAIRRSRLLR